MQVWWNAVSMRAALRQNKHQTPVHLCPSADATQQQERAAALQAEASAIYPEGLRVPVRQWERDGSTVRVSQIDANRILTSLYLSEDYYDVIDIDSFGRWVGSPC